ncbi:MAG: superoxide dismutase [Candidatus Doudnabacteria bacterium]|nr:superoxide dismutase [Candidatus Doudnabacteria bacterium]
MKYTLPKLNYSYDALEPYIDAKTMEIHHTKHHQAYIDKLNAALDKYPELQKKPVEDLLKDLDSLKVDDADRTAIRNHGGGHVNHSFFWTIMGPQKTEPIVDLVKYKEEFTKAALSDFGSGWAWLVADNSSGTLKVMTTSNQDSPLMQGLKPILGIDVWEHAYYVLYRWERAKYVENWWNVINWQQVKNYYKAAK